VKSSGNAGGFGGIQFNGGQNGAGPKVELHRWISTMLLQKRRKLFVVLCSRDYSVSESIIKSAPFLSEL
jgi:hypothetical protein